MKIKLSRLRSLIREAVINMSSMSSKDEALAAVERFINPSTGYSGDYGVVFETEVGGMQLVVGAYQASDEDPSVDPRIEYMLFAPAMWSGSPYASKRGGRGLQPARWSQISVEELTPQQMSELESKAQKQLDEFDPLRHE